MSGKYPFGGLGRDNLGLILDGEIPQKTAFFSWKIGFLDENMWVNDHNMTLLWSFP